MPAKRLSMRKIQEILRLKYESGLSNHQMFGIVPEMLVRTEPLLHIVDRAGSDCHG